MIMAYYTVVLKEHSVFKTNWFNPENHWSDDIFCVIDDIKDMVTFDGVTWNEIDISRNMEIKSAGSGALGIKEPSFKLNVAEIRHRIRLTYGTDKVEIVTDEDCEIVIEDNKCFIVRKQSKYPSTYEDCCKVLGVDSVINDNRGYRWELLCSLQELLVCRDAYWKIAGEQIGLGKSWKPDWENGLNKCCLTVCENRIIKSSLASANAILAFPTEEMRNIFYENFKEEIKNCKELL
jgi:hypothetical protein